MQGASLASQLPLSWGNGSSSSHPALRLPGISKRRLTQTTRKHQFVEDPNVCPTPPRHSASISPHEESARRAGREPLRRVRVYGSMLPQALKKVRRPQSLEQRQLRDSSTKSSFKHASSLHPPLSSATRRKTVSLCSPNFLPSLIPPPGIQPPPALKIQPQQNTFPTLPLEIHQATATLPHDSVSLRLILVIV